MRFADQKYCRSGIRENSADPMRRCLHVIDFDGQLLSFARRGATG
jgi:hypothetical protein